MADWQPIETAPKDNTYLLLHPDMGSSTTAIGYWSTLDDCWYLRRVGHLNGLWEPTHWMPLPEPPEDK